MRRLLCFLLAAPLLGAVSLHAQKSPAAARVIGVIPGAGHMYAGETRRGFAYLGGIVGVLLVGTTALAADCIASTAGNDDCGSPVLENVVAAAAIGLWGYSIYDAGRAAERTNAAHGLRTSLLVAPSRTVGSSGRGRSALKIGVRVGAP